MKKHYWQANQKPCASCPFRKDATLMYWEKEHYQSLLASESDPRGILFGCHKFRKRPKEEYVVCAGWLHDQRERGVPSNALRIALSPIGHSSEACLEALKTVEDGGHELLTLPQVCQRNLDAYEFYGGNSGPVSPEQFDKENDS